MGLFARLKARLFPVAECDVPRFELVPRAASRGYLIRDNEEGMEYPFFARHNAETILSMLECGRLVPSDITNGYPVGHLK